MVDTETTVVPITPMSPAKLVREELCRITGQQWWSDNHCWSYYLKGRREIFDRIYDDLPDEDWQSSAISQLVEQRYIALAYERWATPEGSWVLEGNWMHSRPDILSWMRSIYWKHNKPRRLRLREELRGTAWRPYRCSNPPGAADLPVYTANGAWAAVETAEVDGGSACGESSTASNWKDVMLR